MGNIWRFYRGLSVLNNASGLAHLLRTGRYASQRTSELLAFVVIKETEGGNVKRVIRGVVFLTRAGNQGAGLISSRTYRANKRGLFAAALFYVAFTIFSTFEVSSSGELGVIMTSPAPYFSALSTEERVHSRAHMIMGTERPLRLADNLRQIDSS
jgi:hypothetical protein